MKKEHRKLSKRLVWFIGSTCVIVGFIVPLISRQPFLMSGTLLLALAAIYYLERSYIGILGHVGCFLSGMGAWLAFDAQSYFVNGGIINNSRSIICFWIPIILFIGGFVVFGISTIKAKFVPAEIGYFLLVVPTIVFLPLALSKFAFAGVSIAIGYFLVSFMSNRYGEFAKKVATQHSVQRTAGNRRVF